MLFNSYQFIFLFLPITFFVFFAIGGRHPVYAAAWLTLASLFFYGWWNPLYVLLLVASFAFNYRIGLLLARDAVPSWMPNRGGILAIGIGVDLLVLCYYKYANFFLGMLESVSNVHWSLANIVLPLGISFFTFTQIAFLADTYERKVKEYNFIHYALFVTYFPHLIAGPVLHHSEMMPQFANAATYRRNYGDIGVGLTFFAIGLFKKTVLADGVAPFSNAWFSAATSGQSLAFFEAWAAALTYTFQLYFDFSGYSDMAIGLSRLFGIRLPLNFASPYKAVDIIDFWHRWHMTLSRFLRDYLYVPLGGNRKGRIRRYVNLMITMLLGGLWHGAGWTFVFWGGLHGCYLVINHAWRALRKRDWHPEGAQSRFGTFAARLLTFVCVVVGWVFFRSSTFDGAVSVLGGMAGQNGVSLPTGVVSQMGLLRSAAELLGIQLSLGGGAQFVSSYLWIMALASIAFFFPNTQEFLGESSSTAVRKSQVGSSETAVEQSERLARLLRWQPTTRWAVLTAAIFAAGILAISRVTEFLYYQF